MADHVAASPVSNNVYDIAKWIALVALPAFGAAYYGLAEIWDLPNAMQVVGTVVVLETLLGALLGISNIRYNNNDARFDGTVIVNRDDDDEPYLQKLELAADDLNEVAGKKELTIKVQNPT